MALISATHSQWNRRLDILKLDKLTVLGNPQEMTSREQLIQEIEEAPDELVQTVLEFVHRLKAIGQPHPLEKFVGILSDSEAEELQRIIATDCRQVDLNEW